MIMDKKFEQPEKIISAIIEADYDYICLIDLKTREYKIFKCKAYELVPQEYNDYDAERLKNTDIYIAEEDRERLTREMDLDYVRQQLQHAGKFTTEYGMYSDEGFQYKQDTFFYLDETKTGMVLTRKDITRLFQREQDDVARIRKAIVELEQANDAKTEFLSNVSHDFRTPLNGILGFAEIGLNEENLESKQKSLENIKMAGSLLLNLVNDTLELSRIESGKTSLDITAFDCSEIIDPIAVSIRQFADNDQVNFIADVSGAPKGMIRGDNLKIQKIILNLLSNAIKFTPAGGTVRYTLQAIDPPADGMTVRIIVEDSGIGMGKDFIKEIYEPFSQEHRAGQKEKEGTGLGLSIVKRMVDMMEGRISVESNIDAGTKFIVELPLDIETGDPEEALTEYNDTADTELLTGKRILLCEDNKMNTEIAVIILEKKNMIVECAVNGEEAVKKFAVSPEHYFDAVLMDIRMPVMNGYQASKAIRGLTREDAGTVPIIALTADAFEESIREAKDTGMNAYMIKPFDPKQLYKTLVQQIIG